MHKKYLKYNKKLLLIFFSFLFVIIGFNVFIDPFCIFNTPSITHINKIKSDKNRNQRITKIVKLKINKQPLEAVFLGSSRVNSSIDEECYKKLTGKNTSNLGMNALSHEETFKIAYHTILIHPEIKTIYIGLDFFRFLERNKDNKRIVPLSNDKKLTLSEINPLLFSFNTTVASINTVSTNVKKKKIKNQNKTNYFIKKLKQYSGNYSNAKLAESEFEKFKNFKDEMEIKGYKIVFYTNPTHITDLSLINQLGYLPLFNKWKIKLAENFSFIDFDFANEITEEEVNQNTKYFSECSHSTTFMGELILDNLINKSNNYGKEITKENIAIHNNENAKEIKVWEEKNPDWLEKIKGIANEKV